MPTYEYRCAKCGETFDVFQKFSARPLRTHEGCGGDLSKVLHPAGIVFKGPGFYSTDSRSASSASKTSGSKSDAEKSSSDSDSTDD